MLNLFPDTTERLQLDSSFFNSLILDYNTATGKPNYDSFLIADKAVYASANYIVTCITCHRQHGSDKKHLRRFSDKAVTECVGCHSKSPDISR
jgi:predicted CXXCH cytochrome family protein